MLERSLQWESSSLEDYDLGQYLGCGSFGFVFEESVGSVTRTALKIILDATICTSDSDSDGSADSAKTLDRFGRMFRECDTILGKQHPNIVTLISFSQMNSSRDEIQKLLTKLRIEKLVAKLFFRGTALSKIGTMVMRIELCGLNLRKWLNHNVGHQMDKELAHIQVEIVNGLISGLRYLHRNMIMHRDLKPENVMFSYSESKYDFILPVKIGDFGLCRRVHGEESDGPESSLTDNVGTFIYQAPETIWGTYSLQTDLYSLGLICWEVIQLISKYDRRHLFPRLVHDGCTNLVTDHPHILNSRELIIGLTMRRIEERTPDINQVVPLQLSDDVIEGTVQLLIEERVENVVRSWPMSKKQALITAGVVVVLIVFIAIVVSLILL